MITAIIPTYRRPQLLKRAIKSVLNQTYPHLKVCVYDNASNDETADVVAGISNKDSRVLYHCHSENIGALKNFNYGLKNVRTPFFSLLSDDDVLLPEFYEVAINGMQNYPEAAFYATEVIHIKPDGTVAVTANSTWRDSYHIFPKGLLAMFENGRQTLTWTGILFRTMVIEQIGLLDEAVGLASDHDYLQRIAARFPYGKSKGPGAIFFMHSDSFSATAELNLVWPCWLKMVSNITENNYIPLFVREQVSSYLMQTLKIKVYSYGKQFLLEKKYTGALRVADILYSHLNKKAWALMIYFMVKCCRVLPFLQNIVSYSFNFRRRLILNLNKTPLPEKYAQYLKEL
jgi:glycosyltransferase involved in cell wall biosynthesis